MSQALHHLQLGPPAPGANPVVLHLHCEGGNPTTALAQIEWKDLKMLLAYRPQLQDKLAYHVQKQLAERISQYPSLWAPSLKVGHLAAGDEGAERGR